MTFFKNNGGLTFAITAVVLLVSSFISSCKKDKAEVPVSQSSIEGKWTGNKGYGNDVPDNDLLLNINPGGVIQETNTAGLVKGSGTWTLTGTSFTAHYQFKAPLNTKYLLKGTYDKSTGKITGTWNFDDGGSDEGNWYANKK